jgi:hypothetical protein
MILDFCIGRWESSVLIINNWASWSDKPFKVGVIVSFKSKYINENVIYYSSRGILYSHWKINNAS